MSAIIKQVYSISSFLLEIQNDYLYQEGTKGRCRFLCLDLNRLRYFVTHGAQLKFWTYRRGMNIYMHTCIYMHVQSIPWFKLKRNICMCCPLIDTSFAGAANLYLGFSGLLLLRYCVLFWRRLMWLATVFKRQLWLDPAVWADSYWRYWAK